MEPERWELGSDFHFEDSQLGDSGPKGYPWEHAASQLWGCGRSALSALLDWGGRSLGWRQLWAPSYYCQDVFRDQTYPTRLQAYRDAPTLNVELPPAREGDAILIVNYFGLRKEPGGLSHLPPGVAVIEDHTHDPLSQWAKSSNAHYCFASLRKSMPLPDGAALWSPKQNPMPEPGQLTAEHASATLARLSGMLIKSLYLRGQYSDKAAFRECCVSGEQSIGRGRPSSISKLSEELLSILPASTWRKTRARNFQTLCDALGKELPFDLLRGDADVVPYAANLVFKTESNRNHVRSLLIDARIYPAVLWPMEESPLVSAEDVDLSRRILSIHCDHRYSEADMARVAEILLHSTRGW